jgi:immune inhibitor A
MKRLDLYLMGFILIFVCSLSHSAWAMPPHPDLLDKIQPGEVPEPGVFKDLEELRARGVNSPTTVQLVRDIAAGSVKADFNAIAILVDFSDNIASVQASFFDTLLYQDQTGTLRDYWSEVTYGNLTVMTLDLPGTLGWKRAPETYAYYVDGQMGFGSYPQNAQRLAEDAVQLADPFVNFANYDNDSDGYVDALFIIHSGRGHEFTGNPNHIWSHKWNMKNPQSVDGVIAHVYSMEPEYWSTPGDMTCGVYAHEMGHSVFGLPDLYDYGYDSEGLGDWSLMAGGSWNGPKGASPAHPDAWCRIQTGAAAPIILSANLLGASIPAVNSTPTIYRLWTDGTAGSEFMLVENRRMTGYDSYLPSEGLLIYHVDETQSGNNNQWYPDHTDYGHYLVALEQADGQWWLERSLNSGDLKDPYPGSTDNRAYDDASRPDSRDYNFNTTRVAVRNISGAGPTMTADLYVTLSPPDAVGDLEAALAGGAKSASGDVVLTWTEPFAEAGVDHYVVYRSTVIFSTGDSLMATAETQYTDPAAVGDTGANYYYTVKVVDSLGKKSPHSNRVGEFDMSMTAGE